MSGIAAVKILPCDREFTRDVLALAMELMALKRLGFKGSITGHFDSRAVNGIEIHAKTDVSDLLKEIPEEVLKRTA